MIGVVGRRLVNVDGLFGGRGVAVRGRVVGFAVFEIVVGVDVCAGRIFFRVEVAVDCCFVVCARVAGRFVEGWDFL